MYSSIENVNILTRLLVDYGVRRVVVCPGSRNAPLVHNFRMCEDEFDGGLMPFRCYPVTDERSAGFFAIGLAQESPAPVAVCVTSGSALLNLAPAVAEAYYQDLPLIVISADRPAAWIDQLDGQTLPQPGALGRFVRRSVSLPEVRTDEDHWLCNRLVNEALQRVGTISRGPVHINVPISEPLFQFTCEQLPEERIIRYVPRQFLESPSFETMLSRLFLSRRPMIIVGQTDNYDLLCSQMDLVCRHFVVLHEALAAVAGCCHFDEVLFCKSGDAEYQPDFVLYMGGTLVSKRLKRFLRALGSVEVWAVSPHGEVHDTFQHLEGVIEAQPQEVLQAIADWLKRGSFRWDDWGVTKEVQLRPTVFHGLWQQALSLAATHAATYEPPFSQMAAVRLLERCLTPRTLQGEGCLDADDFRCHYANSSAIRLANIYANHYVYCNRGVNGIEGSLSAAAGFCVAWGDRTFCVIGDLSFFYDQNALWNTNLRDCPLRILLLNNGRGGIFNMLPGLEDSPARDAYVAAGHSTSAEGICRQNHVAYLSARTPGELSVGIEQLVSSRSEHPLLLEVFTDPEADRRALTDYYHQFTSIQSAT